MIERSFVKQGIKRIELEKYLKSNLEKAGFTRAELMKTPLVTRIVVNVSRPGLAIGKGGQNIRKLTEEIGQKFGIDNPQLEIKEIEVPELDAQAMADKMKNLMERGYSWRSVAYRSLRDITRAHAQGAEILLSGALAGKGQRKRKQRIAEGYMKKVGDQTRLVDRAKADAYTKIGAIGVKVRIVKPGVVFPDKVVGKKMLPKEPEEEKEAEEEAEEKEKKEETGKPAEEKAEKKGGTKGKEENGPIKKEAKEGKEKTGKKTEKKEEPKKENGKEKKEKELKEKKPAEKEEGKKTEEKKESRGKKLLQKVLRGKKEEKK